jgi:hypothetical protein
LVDFGQWDRNTTVRMIHLPASLPGGRQEFPIFTVDIQNTDREITTLPENLPTHRELNLEQAVNAQKPRTFSLQLGRGMRWTINGVHLKRSTWREKKKCGLVMWRFGNFLIKAAVGWACLG